jgi:tetratricopeptide (TPR) repeat protein
VIKKYPRSEVKELARYELADCYRHLISPQTSQYEQLALEIYHDLAKTKLYGPQALYKIASIYLKKRKIGQAVEVYEQILEHPEAEKKLKAYAQFGIGQAFYSYGDYEKAIENFVKVKEKHRVKKVLENAYFFLAECYWNLSEFDQARVHYEEFIKQFPKSKFVFNSLEAISECYERTGRLDLAVKTCDRLLARLPHHPKAAKIQLRKANLLFNDKKYVLARREYEKVIVQYPSAEEAAKAKASLKDCDEALALEGLEKAKKMYYFALQKSYAPDAEVYYEKAIKAFQKLIDKYPQTLTAINCQLYIANCWENLDQYKRALKLYEQIMEKIRTGDPRFGERLLSYVKEKIESLSDLEKF